LFESDERREGKGRTHATFEKSFWDLSFCPRAVESLV